VCWERNKAQGEKIRKSTAPKKKGKKEKTSCGFVDKNLQGALWKKNVKEVSIPKRGDFGTRVKEVDEWNLGIRAKP